MLCPLHQKATQPVRHYEPHILIAFWIITLAAVSALFLSCKQLDQPKTDDLYSEALPPRKQEFRWSNGKAPKSFDPAVAVAPPETDIVRAIYEGLTEVDPKTLHEIPGIAEKWTASGDYRIWTFQLRNNAKWSNGDVVKAEDFVRSWKRLNEMGESVAHRDLLENILGMHSKPETPAAPRTVSPDPPKGPASESPTDLFTVAKNPNRRSGQIEPSESSTPTRHEGGREEKHEGSISEQKFGVEAVNDFVLKVSLIAPDKDFPRLVAHPIFSPVFGDGAYFSQNATDRTIITNGPFRVSTVGPDGVTVTRSEQYWDAGSVKLESIRFVPAASAEKALESYRSGDLDAVTNADLEPLALKLLSPYADFRQATHNALNFYEFNLARPPFNDRRVREALATGFERDRLTEGEMKGSTEPAFHFLPYDTDAKDKLSQDIEGAKKLLESAGFPGGENFPVIHLVVNRNETQLRIARSVVRMWKQNLNLNAEIVVKEPAEMDSVRNTGDFDVIRRGVVFPTLDRSVSLRAIFPIEGKPQVPSLGGRETESRRESQPQGSETIPGGPYTRDDIIPSNIDEHSQVDANLNFGPGVYDFRLIPLYFPMSYGLVKPYVQGFDINGLDSPSLKGVTIDSDWQPKP